MATNQQREELHRTIWSMADELRGAVGGWEFKAYVLGTLFYRFISENLTDYINELQREAGVEDFDYAQMDDDEAEAARTQMVEEKGFFILPSQLFSNVCKNCENDENLNMTLSEAFKAIESSAILRKKNETSAFFRFIIFRMRKYLVFSVPGRVKYYS